MYGAAPFVVRQTLEPLAFTFSYLTIDRPQARQAITSPWWRTSRSSLIPPAHHEYPLTRILQVCRAGAGRHLDSGNRYGAPRSFRVLPHAWRIIAHRIRIAGSSFVITKMGLNHASELHGFEGEGYSYFKSPIWWGGMVTSTLSYKNESRNHHRRALELTSPNSGHRRGRQLCRICVCACDTSHSSRSPECADRVWKTSKGRMSALDADTRQRRARSILPG